MELQKLKEWVNLPSSKSARETYNHVIGVYLPGGNEILDICERLHKAQHGRKRPDPMLQDLLDMALAARDRMVEVVQNCGDDGILARL